MVKLKKGERLVFAGNTALRAPDGRQLPSVPQYMIISARAADPAAVRSLKSNERLVQIGTLLSDRKRAEERYAALKAGGMTPTREGVLPLYIKEDAGNIDQKTRLSRAEKEAIDPLIVEDFVKVFAAR